MKFLALILFSITLWSPSLINGWVVSNEHGHGEDEASLQFGFHTENGQNRSESINVKNVSNSEIIDNNHNAPVKPVEYRGGYSFISADGYEYIVKYKANKNGFQPIVTAKKLIEFYK